MQLRTREEYQAIARNIAFPTKAIIAREQRAAISGAMFTTSHPANGEGPAQVAACSRVVKPVEETSLTALRVARALKAATATVNAFGEGDITTPFGDYKQSGFGGRDNSIHAHDQYTQLKTIWLDLSSDEEEV